MIHLRTVALRRPTQEQAEHFPFSVPVIRSLSELRFAADVTFFVGENGSGKSTLMEGIAAAAGSITVGSEEAEHDPTLSSIRELARVLKLTWTAKRKNGFFMRSEDFLGYVKRLSAMRESLLRDLAAVDEEYKDRPEGRDYARMPYLRELADLTRRYGESLDGYSHGESYFTLFKSRFVPGGLYLLDEPEAPLSPARQIRLLGLLQMMVQQDAQFIIATHSPILLAFPGAAIWRFDGGKIAPAEYESLDHVVVTRTFLNNPTQYLERLLRDLE